MNSFPFDENILGSSPSRSFLSIIVLLADNVTCSKLQNIKIYDAIHHTDTLLITMPAKGSQARVKKMYQSCLSA